MISPAGSRPAAAKDKSVDVPNLYERLPKLLKQIPAGRVTTYGDLARALGDVAAARWVGEYMRQHPHSADCPCHRVVRQSGDLGLYVTGDVAEKERRLRTDGVAVWDSHTDVEQFGFRDFQCDAPLRTLAVWQAELPRRVVLRAWHTLPELVAAVDVSYIHPREAVAAYVLVETKTSQLVWSTTLRQRIHFPYIPGYLAFREAPLLLELFRAAAAAGHAAEIVLVDGNGMLHHRRAGIAAHFGVMADVATIGIGKKLLCGTVDVRDMDSTESRPVLHEGDLIGMAMKSTPTSRPIFVSPGQGIDVESCVRMTRPLFHGHRSPEPIYLADRLSREAARKVQSRPETSVETLPR